ncbi:MAG: hypothetical protein FHP92_19285 [Denitromonas halophila]|nr:MAG: hypothetical protein FHP92_19285 [Denitromonas halophila]
MTVNVNDAGAHQTDSNEISDRQLPELLAFILIAAFVCAVIAVAAYWHWFGSMSVVSNAEAWGQLGDFFGGVLNPAFSFLTLFGLLLTLAVQSKELKLARQVASDSKEALVLSQKEMEKSARALEAQISATQHQRFDQSFFSWLDSYRKRVEYEERKEPLDLLQGDCTYLAYL